MGRVDGKIAFVTGAARGQGRAHAVRLAREGADVIVLDVCRQLSHIAIPMATPEDLRITAEQVERAGRRVLAIEADVRDQQQLTDAVGRAYHEFGTIDIVIANAGVTAYTAANDIEEGEFEQILNVNLLGVWRTCKAAAQRIIASNKPASMVLISSVGGLKGGANCAHYNASKHGVIGLMRTLAIEYAPASIRVNAICPTNVNTPMLMADETKRLFIPSETSPSQESFAEIAARGHTLQIGWVEPEDVASAALFLASEEARYITGVALPVDAGAMLK